MSKLENNPITLVVCFNIIAIDNIAIANCDVAKDDTI